ncbi:MAG: hypothetical protein ABI688_03340 [Bacteroidota bacterium]
MMTLRQTDNYIKACMNTWLLCEACIHAEKDAGLPNKRLIKIWSACGQSCISIVARFISDPLTIEKHVFDCFLYCRECYQECLLHPEEAIEYCGEVSKRCAEILKELMLVQLN